MKTSFRAFIAVVVMALSFTALSPVLSNAQTTPVFKRGVLIEEPTGQWCGHCPLGAWYMDSLMKYMGDNAVIISWHNRQGDGDADDVMESPASIAWHQAFGISSWPGYVFGRYYLGGYGYVTDGAGKREVQFIKNSGLAKQAMDTAKKASVVDFRIVNVAYDPGTRKMDFDLDITPYDVNALASEDKTQYALVAVVTEDNINLQQHNYGYDGMPNPSWIDPFFHQNVGRTAVSDVMGDVISMDLANPTPKWPIRQHYSASISNAWDANNIKLKVAFVSQTPKTGQKTNTVLNAAQSKYAMTYPASAPDALWLIAPTSSTVTTPAKPTANVIWASGGLNQAQSVKLQYTVDNGATWTDIVASTSASPYQWTIPIAAFGKTAKVRATNTSNQSVQATSDAFLTPGIITISKPAAGESIDGGTQNYQVTLGGGNYTNRISGWYSVDNGANWVSAGQPLSVPNAKTYNWAQVPNTGTTTALFRITDDNGVVGVSAPFTIKENTNIGKIATVTVDSVNNGHMNSGIITPIRWTPSGNLGTGFTVDYNYTGLSNGWQLIGSAAADATSTNWTVGINRRSVQVRVTSQSGISQVSESFSVGTNKVTGVTLEGLTNNAIEQGKTATIKWTSLGEVGNKIIIEYSNNGSTWNTINDTVAISKTSYDWTPDATQVSPTARIRVGGDLANSSAISNNFKVTSAGAVYSETPVGGYSIANYPNPVSAQTNIVFTMAERGYVTMILHDELGREVAHIASGNYEAGAQNIVFDASSLAAGVYSCTLETNGVHLVKKLTVTK